MEPLPGAQLLTSVGGAHDNKLLHTLVPQTLPSSNKCRLGSPAAADRQPLLPPSVVPA